MLRRISDLPLAILCIAIVSCTTTRRIDPATSRHGAERLARSFPQPTLRASHITRDFALNGDTAKSAWRKAVPVQLERESRGSNVRPELSTNVRALYSDRFLYLAYDAPFTTLTKFEPVQQKERFGLWERDVVEAFIGSDTNDIRRYTEYEVSPNNERLDVRIALPKYDFDWSSGFESATRVDENQRIWRTEMRIPLTALGDTSPRNGTQWRINLYRCDYSNKAFLAWNPTLNGSFHIPERFGILEFTR